MQTKNFQQVDSDLVFTAEQDERFEAIIRQEKETFVVIPEWQKTVQNAGEAVLIGYAIAWHIAMDKIGFDEAQADLTALGLGDARDWVVALSFLPRNSNEPQDPPVQPTDDPAEYDPEITDASNHFSPDEEKE